MNLAQLRTAVREALHAGKDTTTYTNVDLFWSDSAVNFWINEAYQHVQKVIRRSATNYFSRVMRSTDSPTVILNRQFDPSSLRITQGVGSYTLPPDFMRLVLIRDLRTDRQTRFRFASLTKEEFRRIYTESFSSVDGPFLCDIIGPRTLVLRPLPNESFDIELVYDRFPEPLNDYATGTVSVSNGSTTATFSGADLTNQFAVGDELVLGVDIASPGGQIDISAVYPAVASIDSATQVTLSAPYFGPNLTDAKYIRSRVPTLPPAHHQILVSRAVIMSLSKGTNPHLDAVSLWNEIYNDQLSALIGDVEIRQYSDPETADAYLEDDY